MLNRVDVSIYVKEKESQFGSKVIKVRL